MPRAKIHDVFVKTIDDIAEWAEINGKAANNIEQNKWFIPDKDKWSGDPLDIPGIKQAFDREDINENYEEILKDAFADGRNGEAGVLKQQLDYVASAERAYRLSRATSVRCAMHHSIRREKHGHQNGVFKTVLASVVNNLAASSPA
jgi:hypothetical protein